MLTAGICVDELAYQWLLFFPFRSRTVLIANQGARLPSASLASLRKLAWRAAIVYHEGRCCNAGRAVALADVAFQGSRGRTPVSAYLDARAGFVTAARTCWLCRPHCIQATASFRKNAGFCARGCRGAGHRLHRPHRPEASVELMGDKIPRARNFVEGNGFPVAPLRPSRRVIPRHFLGARARFIGGCTLLVKAPPLAAVGKGNANCSRSRSAGGCSPLPGRAVRGNDTFGRWSSLYRTLCREKPTAYRGPGFWRCFSVMWCICFERRNVRLQRRFQKIIEENGRHQLSRRRWRQRICETPRAGIARAAGYRNAGTVEFIFGGGEFYFLEMKHASLAKSSIRLDRDDNGALIWWPSRSRIAGETGPLSFVRPDISAQGHAIEAQTLLPKSPERGFFANPPATGTDAGLISSRTRAYVFDTGASHRGSRSRTAFDPMLAKVDRPMRRTRDCRRRQGDKSGFRRSCCFGCETKRRLFWLRVSRRLAGFPERGKCHTGYLDENPTIGVLGLTAIQTRLTGLLAVAALVDGEPVGDAGPMQFPALHAAIGGLEKLTCFTSFGPRRGNARVWWLASDCQWLLSSAYSRWLERPGCLLRRSRPVVAA